MVDGEEGSLYKLLGVGCGRITEEDLTFYLGEGDERLCVREREEKKRGCVGETEILHRGRCTYANTQRSERKREIRGDNR